MKSTAKQPKGWPKEIQYLQAPSYTDRISKGILTALHSKPPAEPVVPAVDGPSTNVVIKAIASPQHPANGQYGLFANKRLMPDSLILFYIGVIHGQAETDLTSDYDLSLDRELGVAVDAATAGNEARFINDYRGIREKGPNAEFREAWVASSRGGFERRMAVFVLPAGKSGKRSAGIKKGEEILVSYGKGFWNERQRGTDEAR